MTANGRRYFFYGGALIIAVSIATIVRRRTAST